MLFTKKSHEFNDFLTPVGSIPYNSRNVQVDDGSYDVVGRGGSVRHSGQFSAENPYYTQLQFASNNKDKDALYERAVEWEADYANRQLQLAENRAILEEQRAYDDPQAQIARMRSAGINPDITGSTGGSTGTSSASSAQLVNPALADQQAQSKFSNAYDNTAELFNGIQTGVSLLSAVSGAASVGVQVAKDISTFGDYLSMSSSAAKIAENNVANSGLQTDISRSQLHSNRLANFRDSIQTAASISSMFGNDASIDDIRASLQSFGYDGVDDIMPFVANYRKSPQLQAYLNGVELEHKRAKAENDAATYDMLNQTYSNSYAASMYASYSEKAVADFQARLDVLTMTSENAESIAETFSYSNELTRQQAQLECDSFKVRLSQCQTQLNDAIQRRDEYRKKYHEHPTATNKSFLDSSENYVNALIGATCKTLSDLYDLSDKYAALDYVNSELVNDRGHVRKFAGDLQGRIIDMNNFIFDKLYNPANSSVDLSPAITAVTAAAIAYFSKGKSAPKSGSVQPQRISVK